MRILWWWACSLLYFVGFWTQVLAKGRNLGPDVNNLFCSAYYMCKIVQHQYLGHKSFRKIKKTLHHVEGALFVMIMVLIIWRFELWYQLDYGYLAGKLPEHWYSLGNIGDLTFYGNVFVLIDLSIRYFSSRYLENIWT